MADELKAIRVTLKLHKPQWQFPSVFRCPNCNMVWPCEIYIRAITTLAAFESLPAMVFGDIVKD